MWGKSKNENPGGTDLETAAARVTAEEEKPEETIAADPPSPLDSPEQESLEVPPEVVTAIARAPYAAIARFYHPAFALSDEQAEKLGPKMLPLIRKITDVWIPSWLAGASNRNPELRDAVLALAVTGYVQWMHVQKVMQAEAEAAENAKRVKGERVTEMPIRSDAAPEVAPEVITRVVGARMADGSIVI